VCIRALLFGLLLMRLIRYAETAVTGRAATIYTD
jgi:hypothetical protein